MNENVMFWESSRAFDNGEKCLEGLTDLSFQYSVNGLDSEPAIDGKIAHLFCFHQCCIVVMGHMGINPNNSFPNASIID